MPENPAELKGIFSIALKAQTINLYGYF